MTKSRFYSSLLRRYQANKIYTERYLIQKEQSRSEYFNLCKFHKILVSAREFLEFFLATAKAEFNETME